MTIREKKALALAGLVLAVFVVLRFFLFPLWDERVRVEEYIALQNERLSEMKLIRQNLQGEAGKRELERLQKRPQDFSLFAYVERVAAETGVKSAVETMQPIKRAATEEASSRFSYVGVDLQLKAIGLTQLVHFLAEVESSEQVVAVERITIQAKEAANSPLDASIRVASLVENVPQAKEATQ